MFLLRSVSSLTWLRDDATITAGLAPVASSSCSRPVWEMISCLETWETWVAGEAPTQVWLGLTWRACLRVWLVLYMSPCQRVMTGGAFTITLSRGERIHDTTQVMVRMASWPESSTPTLVHQPPNDDSTPVWSLSNAFLCVIIFLFHFYTTIMIVAHAWPISRQSLSTGQRSSRPPTPPFFLMGSPLFSSDFRHSYPCISSRPRETGRGHPHHHSRGTPFR